MNSLTRPIESITAEIKVYEQSMKESIARHAWEIGKRLNEAKSIISHGLFSEWVINNFEFTDRYAREFMKFHEQNRNLSSVFENLEWTKIREVMSLPESIDRSEFIKQEHTVPSTDKSKSVDEMTVRELREVKKALKDKEKEVKDLQDNNLALHDTIESLKSLPPQTKQVVKEVVPERIKTELEDLRSKYDKTKSNEEALQRLNGEIDSEKSRLEEYISSSEFELLETKRKEEIMQSKTHVSMFDLQLKIQKFINEAAPSLYLQGAMAYADSYVRKELLESVKSLEYYVENLIEFMDVKGNRNKESKNNYNNIIEIN